MKNTQRKTRRNAILTLVICLLLVPPVLAQISDNYDLSWHNIAGGGGRMESSGGHQLNGSSGQAATGTMAASGGHMLCSGFWCSGTTVTETPPDTPVLVAPPNGHITTTHNITLQWQAGAGAAPTGYNVELDGTVITTTQTTSPTVLATGEHTWTVRAFNAAGYSDWAASWTVEVMRPHHHIYLPLLRRDP